MPTKKLQGYCDKPDRDVPKIKCGYPLPCPHHTVIVDTTGEAVTVTTPIHSKAEAARGRLLQVGSAIKRSR